MLPLLRALSVALLALTCSAGVPSPVMSQTSLLTQKSAEANEIAAVVQRDGRVRVIVMFQPPEAASRLSLNDPGSVAAVKSQVAAVQDAIIARHFGSAASPKPGQGFRRGVARFDLTPGFAVNVNAAELQELVSDPQVTAINFDRAVPPL